MDSLVIYATRTGNTRAIAEAIAGKLEAHGPVHIRSVEEIVSHDAGTSASPFDGIGLLVVGGPTEGHGVTDEMDACLDRIRARRLDGLAAVAFDTRLWWPKALSGSAATGIAAALREAGATLVVEPESFIVSMKPALQPGELERAMAWASGFALLAEAATPPAHEPVAV